MILSCSGWKRAPLCSVDLNGGPLSPCLGWGTDHNLQRVANLFHKVIDGCFRKGWTTPSPPAYSRTSVALCPIPENRQLWVDQVYLARWVSLWSMMALFAGVSEKTWLFFNKVQDSIDMHSL
jgi:hypothetical protein